jgi:6-phosphogluconolactonase
MQLNVYETDDKVLIHITQYFIALANKTIASGKRFSVALSGGNSPKKLYALLASDEYLNQVDWSKIDFFFGDERYVPHTDEASNFKMAKEVLFEPLNIPAEQIFPINTALRPVDAAKDYWKSITAYFKNSKPNFDLILLGLGDNSHTASLFPHTNVLHETSASVTSVYLEAQQQYRITLNAPLINDAHNIAFLVYGADKAEAVHHVLEDQYDIENYPAQIIKPANGALVWFMDKDAASKIKR